MEIISIIIGIILILASLQLLRYLHYKSLNEEIKYNEIQRRVKEEQRINREV
jgi:hypothetical protein